MSRQGMTALTKYPRTPHLPWSPGSTDDDKMLTSVEHFAGRQVVVTEKMDGENTTIYPNGYLHARSVDSGSKPWQTWCRALAARIAAAGMPVGWRICGENLFAQHSIRYEDLPTYFMVFGIFDEHNKALPWAEVEEWCALLDLQTVPVLYKGEWNDQIIRSLDKTAGDTHEGYVVRVADGFHYENFGLSVAKFVRKGHVQTDQHWTQGPITPNGLATPKMGVCA